MKNLVNKNIRYRSDNLDLGTVYAERDPDAIVLMLLMR